MRNRAARIVPTLMVVATWATMLLAADGHLPTDPVGGFDTNDILDTAMRSLGPLAMLGWYLWYDKSKSQPRRDRETREERENTAKLYEMRVDKLVDSQKGLAEAFSTALQKQAESFAATVTRMADVHEQMIKNCYHRVKCLADGVDG